MNNAVTVNGVTISTSVIATLVTGAAERVEGVAYVCGRTMATNLMSLITSRPAALTDTVSAEVADGKLCVSLPIAVFFGYPFTELAEKVRAEVAEVLQSQVGVEVGAVDITIEELVFPRA